MVTLADVPIKRRVSGAARTTPTLMPEKVHFHTGCADCCERGSHVGPLLETDRFEEAGPPWGGIGTCAHCQSTISQAQLRTHADHAAYLLTALISSIELIISQGRSVYDLGGALLDVRDCALATGDTGRAAALGRLVEQLQNAIHRGQSARGES